MYFDVRKKLDEICQKRKVEHQQRFAEYQLLESASETIFVLEWLIESILGQQEGEVQVEAMLGMSRLRARELVRRFPSLAITINGKPIRAGEGDS